MPDTPASQNTSPSRGRPWLWAIAAVLGLVLLWSSYWFYMALEKKSALERWTLESRQAGYGVGYFGYRLDGWPFKVRLTIDRPSLAAPNAGRPVVWEGDKLTFEARPWNPFRINLDASGPNRFGFHDGHNMRVFGGVVDLLQASVQVDGRSLEALNLDLKGAKLKERDGVGAVELDGFRGLLVAGPNSDAPDTFWTVEGNLTNLKADVLTGLPLGNEIKQASWRIRLAGAPLLKISQPSLARWRDDGGKIKVEHLHFRHGPLDLKAIGTLALDGALQPVGSLTTRTQGFFQAVDTLVQRGILESRTALTAKLVLGVMAQASGGGVKILNLPVSVKNRTITAGSVQLLRFAPIKWPGAASAP